MKPAKKQNEINGLDVPEEILELARLLGELAAQPPKLAVATGKPVPLESDRDVPVGER